MYLSLHFGYGSRVATGAAATFYAFQGSSLDPLNSCFIAPFLPHTPFRPSSSSLSQSWSSSSPLFSSYYITATAGRRRKCNAPRVSPAFSVPGTVCRLWQWGALPFQRVHLGIPITGRFPLTWSPIYPKSDIVSDCSCICVKNHYLN